MWDLHPNMTLKCLELNKVSDKIFKIVKKVDLSEIVLFSILCIFNF